MRETAPSISTPTIPGSGSGLKTKRYRSGQTKSRANETRKGSEPAHDEPPAATDGRLAQDECRIPTPRTPRDVTLRRAVRCRRYGRYVR